MDIFVIHGVNKRNEIGHAFAGAPDSGGADDGFRRKYQTERDRMERQLSTCCQELGFSKPRFFPIYWGGHGARCHFYERDDESSAKAVFRPLVQKGLTNSGVDWSRKARAQGVGDAYYDAEQALLAERLDLIASGLGRRRFKLVELLLASPVAVLETLTDPGAKRGGESADAALQTSIRIVQLAERLVADPKLSAELSSLSMAGENADRLLLELLQRELTSREGRNAQSFGWLLSSALRQAKRPIVAKLKSDRTYEDASRFFGDSMRYFAGRGTREQPGPIVQDVLQQIKACTWPRAGSEPTIFITHSLGGALFYDLFTYFAPELHFDLWLSVGSQLAYYEDAKLLARSSTEIGAFHGRPVPGVSSKVKVELPPGARWYNLFDAQDWLAFAAESVFEDVHDVQLSLCGHDLLKLHTAYFGDARFYLALQSVLKEVFGATAEVDWARLMEAFREGELVY
jgi:hypothetical protein